MFDLQSIDYALVASWVSLTMLVIFAAGEFRGLWFTALFLLPLPLLLSVRLLVNIDMSMLVVGSVSTVIVTLGVEFLMKHRIQQTSDTVSIDVVDTVSLVLVSIVALSLVQRFRTLNASSGADDLVLAALILSMTAYLMSEARRIIAKLNIYGDLGGIGARFRVAITAILLGTAAMAGLVKYRDYTLAGLFFLACGFFWGGLSLLPSHRGKMSDLPTGYEMERQRRTGSTFTMLGLAAMLVAIATLILTTP